MHKKKRIKDAFSFNMYKEKDNKKRYKSREMHKNVSKYL